MPELLSDDTYTKVSRALIYAREHVPLPQIVNLFDSDDVDNLIDGAKKALELLERHKRFLDDSSVLGQAVAVVPPEPESISIAVRAPIPSVTLSDLFEAPEAFPDLGKRSVGFDEDLKDADKEANKAVSVTRLFNDARAAGIVINHLEDIS